MTRRLKSDYKKKKQAIKSRLQDFKKILNDKGIFAELCFCILTPQSKAVRCDEAIKNLKSSGLLTSGSERAVGAKLKGLARFHNKKAAYLISARNVFFGKKGKGDRPLRDLSPFPLRNWLADNVKGLGYKEASHFLRNIGRGKNMAILDTHILKNLIKFGVIEKVPSSLGRGPYLKIEEQMRTFAEKINIPLEELDLLFWSNQTGYIFR